MSSAGTLPKVRASARAKLNLALHVIGKRDDGYHELDSWVTFAEIGDVVSARADPDGPPFGLDVDGPFGEALVRAAPNPAENLAIKAAAGLRALAERQGIECVPVHLSIEKNLPIAAGLGGGSADAAAAIAALSRLWSLPRDLPDRHLLPAYLGADVAMCLVGRPLRARGIGDVLAPIALPALDVVLVNPRIEIATPDVFAREDVARSGALPLLGDDPVAALRETGNDLEAAARGIAPEIGAVLDALRRTQGCELARMSGSGATCLGVYADATTASAAAQRLSTAHPGWWTVATRTLPARGETA